MSDILEDAAKRLDEKADAYRLSWQLADRDRALAEHLRDVDERHWHRGDSGYCGCGGEEPCPDRVSAEKLARTVTGG